VGARNHPRALRLSGSRPLLRTARVTARSRAICGSRRQVAQRPPAVAVTVFGLAPRR
jgi:hypothetical protein